MDITAINLERRPDRKQKFTEWNARPGLTLSFSPAVEGASVSREALCGEGVLAPDNQSFGNGALGNALSHRALWLQTAASNKAALICEDDACLRADFAEAAPTLIACLPPRWDILFLGYNTNAIVATQSDEGLKALLFFDESVKRTPDFLDRYARELMRLAPSTLLRCFQAWGTLCYYISPLGAEKLLRACFPMSAATPITLYGQNRPLTPYTLDGMINVALQRAPIDAFCAFPPLALSENNVADSNVV